MKPSLLLFSFMLFSTTCFSQKIVTWEDLSQVNFIDKYFKEYDQYFLYPQFSDSVKALEGEKIKLTGYFLDIDPSGTIFVLSRGPMAACYFCGSGGPETTIELQFDVKPLFKTDDMITVTGRLRLNADDVNHFNYILEDCEAELAMKE
jgi:hypothetical protein